MKINGLDLFCKCLLGWGELVFYNNDDLMKKSLPKFTEVYSKSLMKLNKT